MNDFMLLLFSLSLSGTVIAGLSFAVKAIGKKKLSKSVLYYFWLIALVRLVLPFSFEGALLTQIFKSEMKSPASAVSSYEPVSEVVSAQTAFSVPTEPKADPVQIAETVAPEIVSVDTPAAASVDMPVITETNMTHAKPFELAALTLWVWLVGFAVFCTFTLTSYALFAVKLKKANRPVDVKVLEIGKLLRCKVKIYQNPLAQTPMLIGLLRPIIILPDIKYTDDELRGALTHELIHKRRHDLLYKWFTLFVNAVHWFNPVVWLVRREVSRACELSCDEAVIMNLQADQKQTYGETLINLAAAHRYPAGVIATTLCEEKRTLKERLSAIMTYKQKGLWNKVLSGILIMAIAASGTLLGACGEIATSLPSELFGQTLKYPDTINVKAKEFFAMADQDNAEKIKQQWLDETSARYGVTLNISSVTTITTDGDKLSSTYSSEIDSILSGQTEFNGLVQIDSFQSLQKAINSNTVMPLDDFLKDNEIWNALPNDLKSTFTYDGHIYAIPTNVTRSLVYPRVIIKNALQQTGMTVTDLASLKNFALAYTQKTGNYALSSFGLGNLQDVLNAYGLYYTQEYYAQPFAYDPTEDCFTDFLTKGAAIDALEYLRELNAAGALDINFDYGYWKDNDNDQYASGGFYDRTQATEEVNLNSAYPQVLENTISGFVMTKNTPQPKETMALVIDMLFGSVQNYLDCWLGSSDNYILNSDGTITVKMVQNADGRYVLPSTPSLTGGLTDVFPYSDVSIYYTQNGVIATEFGAGYNNKNNDLMKEMIEKGKAVKVSPAYSLMNSPTFNASQVAVWPDRIGKITYLFQNCIMDAITSTEYTVQQIVEQYRLDMLNMGGNKMLDEMNAAIGKKTAYYYG